MGEAARATPDIMLNAIKKKCKFNFKVETNTRVIKSWIDINLEPNAQKANGNH